jgi:Domain of unknown function (DUF4388)
MSAQGGSALSLIKAVRELVADGRTGVLDVRADGVGTRIYFDAGKPVFAEDDAPGETFGRLLVRQGVITNDEFVRVIDAMTLAAAGDNPLRFGEVAVGQGVLTSEQVERGLADQVRGIINRAFQRDESRWAFETSSSAAQPPRSFALDIEEIVFAAMIRLPEAYGVVRDEAVSAVPPAAPEGSTHAARLAAEQAFQKGMALLRATQTVSAAIELRSAALLQPESLEYQLCATWAEARGRSEIPGEADQRALFELAQRAKKRDPLFAFASYVLGQLAMWAGDDAAAKKWFYEALRLDPASEAGQQVRILARRGTGTLGPPGTGEPSHRDDHNLSTAPPAAREPVAATPPAATGAPPARTPNRWARWLLGGAALLAAGALVMFGAVRRSAPPAAHEPGASLDPVAPEAKDASASPDGRREDFAASAPARGKASSDDDDKGTVRLPSRASGHRVYVDGRRVQVDETALLRLRCGAHNIQIGSQGTPQPIDLRCGGELQLE